MNNTDHGAVKQAINLSEGAGIAEPEQKIYGKVTPHLKNKWRNRKCMCGSGKKAKKCCGPRLSK